MALLVELALLGSLYFFGTGELNRSWIRFGGIGVQPAELGKLLFIFTFSAHLTKSRERGHRPRDMAGLLLHAGLVTGFVAVFSRDDGMSLAYLAIALALAFMADVRARYFAACGAAAALSAPLIWTRIFDGYQRERVMAVFAPSDYPDAAYQALRCRAAIGSGGLTGAGYGNGALTQAGLIPAKHTDSIIAAAGEELGLIGVAAVILLLGAIIFCCLRAALRAREPLDRLMACGVAAMLSFQTVLNLGMNLGLLPIVGLTLPFFSYGGSSLVTMLAAAGLVAGIGRRARLPDDIYLRY